jgi:hypothetical protein
MSDYNFDDEYADFVFSKAYKVNVDFQKVNDAHIGFLYFIFPSKEMAYTALCYLIFKFKQETVHTSLNINAENKFDIVLEIRKRKARLELNNFSFNLLPTLFKFDAAEIYVNETMVHIGCKYYDGATKDPVALAIYDYFENNPSVGISTTLYTYGNDGLESPFSVRPSLE